MAVHQFKPDGVTCPDCGSENVEVAPEHEEGDRIFCFDCASRAKMPPRHIMLRCPHCERDYEAEIGNNPLVQFGLRITPVPLPAEVEVEGEQ